MVEGAPKLMTWGEASLAHFNGLRPCSKPTVSPTDQPAHGARHGFYNLTVFEFITDSLCWGTICAGVATTT
jgi:hypothetical protein